MVGIVDFLGYYLIPSRESVLDLYENFDYHMTHPLLKHEHPSYELMKSIHGSNIGSFDSMGPYNFNDAGHRLLQSAYDPEAKGHDVSRKIEWQLSLVTGILSLIQVIGYVVVMNGASKWSRCISWEVCLVVFVEAIGYLLGCIIRVKGCPQESFINVGEDKRFVNWYRHGSWFITCPVLLYFITRVLNPAPTNRQIIQSIMLLQIVFVFGVGCAVGETKLTRVTFYCLACSFMFVLFYALWLAYSEHIRELPPQIKGVLVHLYLSWLLFPFFFGLGSDGNRTFSHAVTSSGYAVGDIFSKNLFSLNCVWYLSIYLEERDRKGLFSSQALVEMRKSVEEEQRDFQVLLCDNMLALKELQARMKDMTRLSIESNAFAVKLQAERELKNGNAQAFVKGLKAQELALQNQ